jgi:NAD(P)-dependent dehydrogenase (short-subunit alcohol dehydrogenase family)
MDIQLNTAPLTMNKTGLKQDALAGEVAVVTGGTSNIGLATARCLAWLGAKVVLAARTKDKGAAAAALIDGENKPGTALFISTDISDAAAVKAMAAQALDTFGKVDILVNNAMDMSLGAPILKTTQEQMDRQYAVAVRGALLGIQSFVPGMKARHHGVVTYVSTTFHYPFGPSNYCAVKVATESMLISLANELGPVKDSGVAVFTYIPGLVGRGKRQAEKPDTFVAQLTMPGYPGPYPPEDCGAAFAYSIVHAADIHGSGIMIGHAFRQMNWVFPRPETVAASDFDRINDLVALKLSGYIGKGFPDPRQPLVSINRSDNQPAPK